MTTKHPDCQDECQTAAARGPAYRCDHRPCDMQVCEEDDVRLELRSLAMVCDQYLHPDYGNRLRALAERYPQSRHPTLQECAAAGKGPTQGDAFHEGGLPDTPEERERFEVYILDMNGIGLTREDGAPQLPPLTDAMYHAVRGLVLEFGRGADGFTGTINDETLDEIWENINAAMRVGR